MKRAFVVIVASCLLNVSFASAQEVHYFQGEDGLTYRQSKYIERRPVTSTNWQEQQKTVLKEQFVTEMRDSYRTVFSPVTEYFVEPRWHNWWNPFGQPYVAYHVRPWTRWEPRYERYQIPVTVREVVPEERTVWTPTRSLDIVEEEVTETVAVTPRVQRTRVAQTPVATSPRTVARTPAPAVGGVERLESDPPRYR
jgi:hypothetical protein